MPPVTVNRKRAYSACSGRYMKESDNFCGRINDRENRTTTTIIIIIEWLYNPLLGLSRFFSFVIIDQCSPSPLVQGILFFFTGDSISGNISCGS
jgi:hypothetical protein